MALDPKAAKKFAAARAAIKSFDTEAKKAARSVAAEVAAGEKLIDAAIRDVEAADKKAAALAKGIAAEMTAAKAGALKAYAECVRKSDGLTSMRPSVAKSLDRLLSTLDEKHLKAAREALEKHKSEVLKQAGRTDPKAKAFAKAMDDLISKFL